MSSSASAITFVSVSPSVSMFSPSYLPGTVSSLSTNPHLYNSAVDHRLCLNLSYFVTKFLEHVVFHVVSTSALLSTLSTLSAIVLTFTTANHGSQSFAKCLGVDFSQCLRQVTQPFPLEACPPVFPKTPEPLLWPCLDNYIILDMCQCVCLCPPAPPPSRLPLSR